jgi:hypothetical protein
VVFCKEWAAKAKPMTMQKPQNCCKAGVEGGIGALKKKKKLFKISFWFKECKFVVL